ncbi:Circadian locomoter output cycles protein kaput [Gryllus bimaculatus]|nr:Circadian locomoter output cycles protein kaput [Gryllus bimaculatus]
MSNLIKRGSTRRSDDTMDEDGDDKDDTKRKSRNLSEKKRRDQFNMLINELSSMVSTNSRKMDKSTVLKSTISFLKNHNEIAVRSRAHEIQEDWKPSFLSNEEFTHLILEALDGFIMVFSSSGRIFYASESITSLLGHLPSDLMNMTIYDMVYEEDQSSLYNVFLNPSNCVDGAQYDDSKENQVSFSCHLKRGGLDFREEVTYELVQFVGYFRTDVDPLEVDNLISSSSRYSNVSGEPDTRLVFVGTGRLQTPLLIREMSVVDSTKSEFTSRHSLEWKFLFLDHRAPPIIGYLPFEVLGTSGYDYYHVDDLEKVVTYVDVMKQLRKGTENDRSRESEVSVGDTHSKEEQSQQPQSSQPQQQDSSSQPPAEPESSDHDLKQEESQQEEQVSSNESQSNHEEQTQQKEEPDENQQQNQHEEKVKQPEQEQKQQPQEPDEIQAQTVIPSQQQQQQQQQQQPQQQQTPQPSSQSTPQQASQSGLAASPWSSKSSDVRSPAPSASGVKGSRSRHAVRGPGSDSTSMSADSPSSRHSQVTSHSVRSRASVHGVQVLGKPLLTMATPQQVTPSTATFLEPQQQYVAAIPVQPVLAAGFPGTAAVVTTLPAPELMRQPIVMTTAQSQIQEQLQRKHEELQQLIVQQQEELRRVSEQLLMARYGLLPPVQLNVTLPYSTGTVSSTTNPIVQEGVVSSDMPVPVSSDLFVGSHPPLVRQHPQATSIMVEPHQVNRQNHSTEDVLPFQLSQQQAQLLFSSNSTQHHQ